MIATHVLSRDEQRQIEARIADLENQFAVELVCACSTESGRYDRAESICGLVFAVMALSLAHYLHVAFQSSPGSWSDVHLHLGWQVLAVVVGFSAGSMIASYVHPIRRLLVRNRECTEDVNRAASHVFRFAGLGEPQRRPGLLIYASLFERQVTILTNERLKRVLDQEHLDQLCQEIVRLFRDKKYCDALMAAIDGIRLHLESVEQSKLESASTIDQKPVRLSDHVWLFHPRPG